MPTNILMPALSPTMEKGNLARWLKKEGDKIKSGDVIAEIETDKATMEYEAVDDGTLAKIVVPEGTQDVAVNSVIAVLAGEGEDVKAAAAREERTSSRSAGGRQAGARTGIKTCCRKTGIHRGARRTEGLSGAPAAAEGRQSHFFLAAGAASRQGRQHRSQSRAGLWSAWPCHCARH